MTLIKDQFLKAICDAAVHNPHDQMAPSCILSSDGDCQWEPVLPHLQVELPELFILFDYDTGKRIVKKGQG